MWSRSPDDRQYPPTPFRKTPGRQQRGTAGERDKDFRRHRSARRIRDRETGAARALAESMGSGAGSLQALRPLVSGRRRRCVPQPQDNEGPLGSPLPVRVRIAVGGRKALFWMKLPSKVRGANMARAWAGRSGLLPTTPAGGRIAYLAGLRRRALLASKWPGTTGKN